MPWTEILDRTEKAGLFGDDYLAEIEQMIARIQEDIAALEMAQ